MRTPNLFRNLTKDTGSLTILTKNDDIKDLRNSITVQMLVRLQIFNSIIFLIHLVILLFIVPGNMKIYQGVRLQAYTLMSIADLVMVIGSLIFLVTITLIRPKEPNRVSVPHNLVVLVNCSFLLLWAAVKTVFQQSFDGQISIYLVVLLTAGAGALLDLPGSFILYVPPLAVFIAGSLLNNKTPHLLQDNLINGSALTVVSWILGRILYQNFRENFLKQRIIERQNTDLRESEEKFSKSFQYNKVIMAISSIPEGRYIDVNEEFVRISGLPREQIIGRTGIELGFWIQPEDRKTFLDKFLKEEYLKDYEMDFRHPSGKTLSLIGCLMIIRLNGIPYELFSCQDITERKKAEQELLKLNNELTDRVKTAVFELREKDQMMLLQSRQAAMGEMLSNIAHQWRQPLNATGLIVQNIQQCHRRGELTDNYIDDAVNRAMAQIEHMSKTIDDFRNFFKTDKEKKEFNLKDAVENALSLISASYREHLVTTSLDCPEEITITGFPNEFSQALLNILNNALEIFDEKNLPDPKIAISIRRENSLSMVTVRDNAGGIPKDVLPKIFEPFFTTKKSGTGIGLYMTKIIIEKNMGGRLSASNRDDGAEFRIEF